jgi:hypothetical protein
MATGREFVTSVFIALPHYHKTIIFAATTYLTQGIFDSSFLILRSLNDIFVKMFPGILGNFSTYEMNKNNLFSQCTDMFNANPLKNNGNYTYYVRLF